MKLGYLYLVGGPMDGTYLPVNPKLDGFPSEIAVYAAAYGWHSYSQLQPKKETPKIDVYKILQSQNNSFTKRPTHGQIHEMRYLSRLTPEQAKKLERMTRGLQ